MSHNVIESQQASECFPKEGSSSFSEQRDWGWSDLPKATQESRGTASDAFSFEFCSSTLSVTSTHPSSLK